MAKWILFGSVEGTDRGETAALFNPEEVSAMVMEPGGRVTVRLRNSDVALGFERGQALFQGFAELTAQPTVDVTQRVRS